MSGIYQTGVEVDLRLILMRQVTVELCERYGLNPYRLLCGNCILAAADQGGRLVRLLGEAGIPAGVIGWAQKGDARRIRHGEEEAGYLERPQPDELRRMGLQSL